MRAVGALLREAGGNSGVEYALLAALIAVVVIPTVPKVSNNLRLALLTIETALQPKRLIYVCDNANAALSRDSDALAGCCDPWHPQRLFCPDLDLPTQNPH